MEKIEENIKEEMKVMVEGTVMPNATLIKDLIKFQYRILKDKIWCNNFPLKQIHMQSQHIIQDVYGHKDKTFGQ